MMQSFIPFIDHHLLALQVLLPLLAAPICLLLRKPRLAWIASFVVAFATLLVAVQILMSVLSDGPMSYAMGGWPAPWGIEYRADPLNALMLLIISLIGVLTLAYAPKSITAEIRKENHTLFYTAFLLCFAGLLGICITGDAFNLFVFLEISALSSYVLISMGAKTDRRALTASFQYLIMGTIAATFILIGVGLLYMMTGTLNMADLAARLPEVMDTRTIRAAFAFLTVGISLKLALFPLHLWMPNAYSYAPSVVTAFLAATSTKVALYALLRFVFTVFGVEFAFNDMPLQLILTALAVMAIFVGSLAALFQTNIKHVLAYSSVAQIGYMVLGIAFVTVAGVSAGLMHVFNHALMKGCLFMAIGCIFYVHGSARIHNFKGIGKTMPWTMAAFVIGALSMIGVPLTAGFVSKWYLILAALEHDLAGLVIAAIILAGSLLAVAYVWRLIETAYFEEPDEGAPRQEAPLALLVPTWILALANIYFGLDTDLVVGAATQAAWSLLDGAVSAGDFLP